MPRIEVRDDGFVVIGPTGDVHHVRWRSVVRVLAFKRDLITTDVVLLVFRQQEDPALALHVSEEWTGFAGLFLPMARELGVSD